MKVVSYLSTVPIKDRGKITEKTQILANFAKGVAAAGDDSVERSGNYIPSDVAVIQGWIHERSGNSSHLTLRKQIIKNQISQGKYVITADSNLFLYKVGKANKPHHYLRYSANGIFPTTGNYFWDNPDPARWSNIRKTLDLSLKDYRTNGNHVLICLQRNGGWSMQGLDVMKWCHHTIEEIEKYTDRPIVVRAHPGDKSAQRYLKINHPKVKVSFTPSILDDLKNAWATITYNSSPGVASAIEGVPVFVTDPNPEVSQAYAVANTDLSLIETPVMPERQQWIEKISMCHWNFKELSNGHAWQHMKNFI